MLTKRGLRTLCTTVALLLGCGMGSNLPPDPSEEPAPRPRVRVPDPIVPAAPGQSKNLLQHYVARDENQDASAQFRIPTGKKLAAESETWSLPFKSKRMVAALLTTAARDRLDDLEYIIAADARWGQPDTRMMGARPIFGPDRGEQFLFAFRQAALRFGHPPAYTNGTAFELGVQERLRTGAEPMWAYYESGLDRILFRFRVIAGKAWIDYVGLFEEAPLAPIKVVGKGAAPPMSPPVRMADGSVVQSRSVKETVNKRINPQ